MAELSAGIQAAANAIGARINEGPRTLNELRDWWVSEAGGNESDLKGALRYLLSDDVRLLEAWTLGGGVKMVGLPGSRASKPGVRPAEERPRTWTPGVKEKVSTTAAAPPPVSPPAPSRPSTLVGSPPDGDGDTLNVGPRKPDLPAPPAANPAGSPSPAALRDPAAQAMLDAEWMRREDIARALGIGLQSLAKAIRFRIAAGVSMPYKKLPGKGAPRMYRREDIDKWVAERAGDRSTATGKAAGEADGAAVAEKVRQSNGKRAAIEEALYAGTGEMTRTTLPGPALDVEPEKGTDEPERRPPYVIPECPRCRLDFDPMDVPAIIEHLRTCRPPAPPEKEKAPPVPARAVGEIRFALSAPVHLVLGRMLVTGLWGHSIEEIVIGLMREGMRAAIATLEAIEKGQGRR